MKIIILRQYKNKKTLKINKGGKKYIILTLLPDKYEKFKRIVLENKLSILLLFEQLISYKFKEKK
ncbi:hypothetical protein [Spiroplasma endosymbiont of Stenodema calcarata]|uniref:hypothetical protein n=1 Tax=Spiroplasma endosymbiont of Stenodema calcarata TaxID=3139328 RepID=UPI003CCA9FA3